MKYFKKIIGNRIYLSPLNVDDAELLAKWINDKRISDGVHHTASLWGIDNEKQYIEDSFRGGNKYNFAIVLNDNDQLIGTCGIFDINLIDGRATLGIMIGEVENHNKGYGKEAIGLLLDYGFNILNLHNISLSVYTFNKGALECYKKAGFKEYGIRHECCYLDGKYHDEIFLEMLKEDYQKLEK